MSKRSEQTQLNIRPYKIEVYGLQDNYISTLQSYTDSFLGRVIEPKVKLMDDGTQTFTCKIPKFYIDPKTNQKIINPRWENEASVILAENTHVLKVFIQQGDNLKVFPFIVDKITDRRDSHFSVFKEVEANGLAFSDLGKVGYKLELNSHTLESDYKEDNTVVATIDYWLDKVFPNTKDSNGNIVSWNTPWCYEIKMDWSYFSSERDSTKVYENSYTGSWIYDPNISPTELIPDGTVEGKEKARYIDCVNSNKYNITQTIAETFEVFCRYEYACENNGKFVKEYTDENGKVWTGKKVVFYNKAIKTENPLVIDYQKNLDTITRTADSTDIYTKLFVVPVESVAMNDGYVTIASTQANPILDDFILNFDYLDSVGSINDYQKQFINEYKIQMRLINQELISLGEDIEVSTIDLNTLEAQSAFIEAQQSSLKEQLDYYQGLRDNEVINTPVTRGKDNSYSVVFVKDNVTGNLTASFHGLEGIDSGTIKVYKDFTYEEPPLFSSVEVASSISEVTKNDVVYALLGEDGFPASLAAKESEDFSLGTVYISLTYLPKNKYDKLVNSAQALLDQSAAELDDYENEKTGKIVLAKAALEEKEQLYNDKLLEKAKLNEKFERILGPALREGNWQADNYEDPKDGIVTITGNGYEIENNVEFIFDQEPFENEQKAYVLVGDDPYKQEKYYFHYLNAENFSFENNRLEDLIIRLRRDFTYTVQNTDKNSLEKEFLKITVPFKGQRIVRYVKLDSPLKVGDKILLNYRGNTNNLYFNEDQQIWYEGEAPNDDTQVWDITQKLAYYKKDGTSESLQNSLGEYFLYYGSGFKPTFYNIKEKNTTIPVLLIVGNSLLDINNKTFDYEAYNFISYSFIGKPEVYDIGSLEGNLIKPNEEEDILVYPRIHINAENVQYNSDLMTLKLTGNKDEVSTDVPQLKKFEDYMVLSRKGQAYITLKVTQNNTFEYILSGPYRLDYQISHANEMLYLDAIQVAKDNSHPRYSYELKLANLPHEFAHVGLSEMVYINDHAMGIHAATGYISEVEYDLDEPWNDDIVIQNYKTKFEDLFHTITAQSEAMRKNSPKYDIAASGFTPNGSIAGSVLQQSLNNTQVYLDYSGTGVQITPQDGIILTNTQPYLNGVYGQIKLQGGGIFISSSVDENGNRIWSSSITPLGINANLLTAGQINTENIRIYSGDNMAFQWNPEGIFAYKNVEGELSPNVYVKYSQHGLHYIDETLEWNDSNLVNGKQSLVSLDWNGLKLKNRSGENTFFADMDGNLTLRGTLKSYDYHEGESRLLSTGWKIEAGGYAEFNDLFVRGTISASVFEYEETSAVGGRLLVSPTFILKGEHTNQAQIEIGTDSPLTITVPIGVSIENDGFSAGGRAWKINDVIIFNGKFINKDALEVIKYGKDVSRYPIYEIKQLQMKIAELDTEKQTITLTSIALVDGMTQNLFYGPDGYIADTDEAIQALGGLANAAGTGDWHLISFGTDGAKEGILLTAIEPNSGSYIDILGKGTDDLTGSTRVRLGDLSSLAANEELVEALGSTPSGWGLYADNVFLRGAIYATSGRIGSLSIDEVEHTLTNITCQLISPSNFTFSNSLSKKAQIGLTMQVGNVTTDFPPVNIDENQLVYTYYYRNKTDGQYGDWTQFQMGWKNWKGTTSASRMYTLVSDPVADRQYKGVIALQKTPNATGNNIVIIPESIIETPAYTFSIVSEQLPVGEKYTTTTKNEAPDANDVNWKSNISDVTFNTTNKYLWIREEVAYPGTGNQNSINIRLLAVYGATGATGVGIKQLVNYYCLKSDNSNPPTFDRSKADNATNFNNTWKKGPSTGQVPAPIENFPNLWNIEVIDYTNNTSQILAPVLISQWIQGAPGEPGQNGNNAVNYDIILDTNLVTRDLLVPVSPKSIKIRAIKITGGDQEDLPIGTTTSDKYRVVLQFTDPNGTTNYNNNGQVMDTTYVPDSPVSGQTNINFEAGFVYGAKYANVSSINVQLWEFKEGTNTKLKNLSNKTIGFTLGESLRQLGSVIEGQMYVNNGRVIASSIATGSIISGKVSAGAIETGAIASGSSLYLLSGAGSKFNLPPVFDTTDKKWIPYNGATTTYEWKNTDGTGNAANYASALVEGYKDIWDNNKYTSGIKIDNTGVFIRGTGKFEVSMENFKVTTEGVVIATGGEIGGWKIESDHLYAGSGNNHVSLSSTGEYRIWAGKSEAEKTENGVTDYAPFYVKEDGTIRATKGEIGGWTIGTNSLHAGTGGTYVTLNTDAGNDYVILAGAEKPEEANFAVKKDGTVYLRKLIALGDKLDSNGNPIQTEVNLTKYPLWKLNSRLVSNIAQTDTGFAVNYVGGGTDNINFKKAAIGSVVIAYTSQPGQVQATVKDTNGGVIFSESIADGGLFNIAIKAGTPIATISESSGSYLITPSIMYNGDKVKDGTAVSGDSIYNAGVSAGESKFITGTYYKGNGPTVQSIGTAVTPTKKTLYTAPTGGASSVTVYDVGSGDTLYKLGSQYVTCGDSVTAYTKKEEAKT